MFSKKQKIVLNKDILINNELPLLVTDSRWKALFCVFDKPGAIIKLEKKMEKHLGLQADLIREKQEIIISKKKHMGRIIELTDDVYFKIDDNAYHEMKSSQAQIKEYNIKIRDIDNKFDELSKTVEEINFDILHVTCDIVYNIIKTNKSKVKKIENDIEQMKEILNNSIEKKQELNMEMTKAYSYFHNLIGGEEIEILDNLYLDDE